MFWNKYPYTSMHELNLDWILAEIRKLQGEMADFEAVNTITFSGAWDITKQYPAWTIVSDNNIGYVSIRPVPEGVQLNDTNYWRVVIDYTAQIAGLQTRVITLEGQMSDAQDDIADLQAAVNHRYIIMGDSYAGTGQFIPKLAANLGLDNTFTALGTYCAVNTDKTVYNVSYGGMGFTNNGGGPDLDTNGFLQMLTASTSLIDDPDTITDIVVLGGANDSFWSIWDPVQDNMDDFADYAEANFTSAKLWLGFIARIRGTNPSGITIDNLMNAYYNYSNNKRFTYMHGVEYSLYFLDALLMTDNMHPTPEGGTKIAEKAADILKGGVAVTSWLSTNYTNTVVFDTTKGTSGTGLILVPNIVDGAHIHIDLPNFNWTPASNTLDGEFDVIVGTQSYAYVNKPVTYQLPAAAMYSGGGGIKPIVCSIQFDGFDIHLIGMQPENGMAWTSHTNVTALLFQAVSFDIPLAYC